MEECDINLEDALAAAVEAAQKAGAIMWDFYQYRRQVSAAEALEKSKGFDSNDEAVSGGEGEKPSVSQLLDTKVKSCSTDLVTEYDRHCDEAIMSILQQYSTTVERQKHKSGSESFHFSFITEEIHPDMRLTDAPTWIVDPIDGTMSFVHGSCDCCVSIGLTIKKETVLAVIYCPFIHTTNCELTGFLSSGLQKGELYTAIRGKGAFLNGHPIHVRSDITQEEAIANFGYPMRPVLSAAELEESGGNAEAAKQAKHYKMLDAAGYIRTRLLTSPVRGLRSYGACALILAFVAAGRIDLYMEPCGKIWDVCAGNLLVTEAGGTVRNIFGDEFDMERTTTIIAAANEKLSTLGADICNEVSYGKFWL